MLNFEFNTLVIKLLKNLHSYYPCMTTYQIVKK